MGIVTDIAEEEAKQIKKDIEVQINSSVHDLYHRLYKVVKKCIEKLEGDGEDALMFRNSLIENTCDMMNTMPSLNIVEDGNLSKMYEDIKQVIAGVEPYHLMSKNEKHFDPEVRNAVKAQVDDPETRSAGYFGIQAKSIDRLQMVPIGSRSGHLAERR